MLQTIAQINEEAVIVLNNEPNFQEGFKQGRGLSADTDLKKYYQDLLLTATDFSFGGFNLADERTQNAIATVKKAGKNLVVRAEDFSDSEIADAILNNGTRRGSYMYYIESEQQKALDNRENVRMYFETSSNTLRAYVGSY